MDQEGVELQAVYTLSEERTNITFSNDIRVPDSARIGDVDGGWRVLTASLMDDQASSFVSWTLRLLEEVEAWAIETGRIERSRGEGAARAVCRRGRGGAAPAALLHLDGRDGLARNVEWPMAKLYRSEALTRAAEDLFDLVGPDAVQCYFEPSAPRDGCVDYLFRFSLGTTTYADTSEVQRNMIGQRGLGLPR